MEHELVNDKPHQVLGLRVGWADESYGYWDHKNIIRTSILMSSLLWLLATSWLKLAAEPESKPEAGIELVQKWECDSIC